jgi:hypothetical protein
LVIGCGRFAFPLKKPILASRRPIVGRNYHGAGAIRLSGLPTKAATVPQGAGQIQQQGDFVRWPLRPGAHSPENLLVGRQTIYLTWESKPLKAHFPLILSSAHISPLGLCAPWREGQRTVAPAAKRDPAPVPQQLVQSVRRAFPRILGRPNERVAPARNPRRLPSMLSNIAQPKAWSVAR